MLARVTLEADRLAAGHLSAVLLPLVVGLAAKSLIMDKHAAWYSWFIGALTGCVYTFGFIMMCPQVRDVARAVQSVTCTAICHPRYL